jgi:hypothetical protein
MYSKYIYIPIPICAYEKSVGIYQEVLLNIILYISLQYSVSKYIIIYIHLQIQVISSPRQLQQIRRNADGGATSLLPGDSMYGYYQFSLNLYRKADRSRTKKWLYFHSRIFVKMWSYFLYSHPSQCFTYFVEPMLKMLHRIRLWP